MNRTPRILSLLALLVLAVVPVMGNNIFISNVQLPYRDTTGTPFARVQFDISWQNSWRRTDSLNNWDAAWVFVKYRRVYESAAGATNSGTTVTVASTKNLYPGMRVRVTSGTGEFAAGTTVSSITSATQFTVSAQPITELSNSAVVRGEGDWGHATLAASGHSTGSYTIDSRDGVGAFIHRDVNGTGTFSATNVHLQWNYSSDGLAGGDQVEVRVFGIEMVYVPEGAFYVGSGGTTTTESGSFTDGSWTSGATTPFQITSESALGIDSAAGKLWGTSSTGNNTIGNAPADDVATLPADFPKGYKAFYCMKYEISQGQYRDFLNTLTYAQQASRTATAPTSAAGTGALVSSNTYRSGLDIKTSGSNNTVPALYGCNLDNDSNYDEDVDGEWIACNYLSWADGAAYCDWAGLRPMTELEFEKACRGTAAPLADEYAWGSTSIAQATGITDSGSYRERANVGANAAYANHASVQGPLRVGAFATSSDRAASGASYWGIMELSGNLWERCVTVGNSTGRNFTGACGDGALSVTGNANTGNWPVADAIGAGFRGGHWADTRPKLRVSDRVIAAGTDANRYFTYGFRGVR